VITPLVRTSVPMPYSFFAALAVLSFAMLCASLIFTLGKRTYVLKPAEGAQLLRFVRLCAAAIKWSALWLRDRSKSVRERLLDASFASNEIDDMKSCWSVVRIFAAVFPIFFSVLEQQGSRWVFQVLKMDRKVPFFSALSFPPDATGIFFFFFFFFVFGLNKMEKGIYNPILVLICVPVFAWLLQDMRPLRKILLGLFLGVGGMATSAGEQIFLCEDTCINDSPFVSRFSVASVCGGKSSLGRQK
jgi:dipeptide/tripeptide permease